ncbi:hypothetical protein AMTRI_Chr05g66760 [Amborella trichopoda]
MIKKLQYGIMALSSLQKWFFRGICSASSKPLHVCVVGGGPAGFYTAEKMLKAHKEVQLDIIDRLPTPFGLVRSGVAPDHPETKIVVNQFSRLAENERFSFFGNVSLGTSVSLSELCDIYHVVVLAYGAESDRILGIPGEDLNGIHSAREFVWWYNGHPDCKCVAPELKTTDTAVVLGQGNVALDIARILLQDPAELERTDIAEHALASLRESSIRKVYLVGRRGPVQAACTAKELREILSLKHVQVHIQEADLVKSPLDEEELKRSRIQRRVYDLLSKIASSQPSDHVSCERDLHFVFFRRPASFLPCNDANKVCRVRLEKTFLKENGATGRQSAVGSGEFEELECGLVFKSIGYKSLPVDGLPFNDQKGIVPNDRGRVLSNAGKEPSNFVPGLYVVGWLKRGPTGIIATNLYCAEETVGSITEDLQQGALHPHISLDKPGRDGLLHILQDKNIRFVSFKDWEKINTKEINDGKLKSKPREKITSWEELQEIATQ